MEILSDVLRAVRLTGALFFDVELATPWAAGSPSTAEIARKVMPEAEHVIGFHAMLSGACWAELGDGASPALRMEAGDVVVIPSGVRHTMASAPGLEAEPDLALYRRPADRPLPIILRSGGAGEAEKARFVCGYLGCDARPFNPLLDALPGIIHARGQAGGAAWVGRLIQVATDETQARRAGGEIVLARLSELLFVEVLRGYLDSLPEESRGWLAGLRDRHVGAALRLIHARPTDPWTLEGLAREVGLSRSAFAERFAQYVGMAPMHYLGRWRMQLAARLLERPGTNVAAVAEEVGYESEAAFNRAFKKLMGAPPGAWRRHRMPPPVENGTFGPGAH
jgi:AraC-like DNA-binding protein